LRVPFVIRLCWLLKPFTGFHSPRHFWLEFCHFLSKISSIGLLSFPTIYPLPATINQVQDEWRTGSSLWNYRLFLTWIFNFFIKLVPFLHFYIINKFTRNFKDHFKNSILRDFEGDTLNITNVMSFQKSPKFQTPSQIMRDNRPSKQYIIFLAVFKSL
jgi:hypothetical protein